MTETTNPTQQQDTDAGDLPGADLARIALRQAREAAKARGQSGIRKAKPPARTAATRRDGREPTGFAAVLAGLLADRGWDVPAAGGSILDQWHDIAAAVSPNLASHVSAVAFHTDSGQLDLHPDSPAYATQLRLLSTRVIAAANDAAGTQAVRTIRVMNVGATGPAPREAAAAPIPAPAPKVPVKTREDASPGFHQALAAHQAATPPSRVDPSIAEAVERQTAAMRALSLQAFPEPEQAADEPAPIEPARTERRRQADASHTAALRRARTERAAREAGAAVAVPTLPPLGRTA
ncbi:DciA family protein [Streptomyces qinglanensis]|uniref:DciA family protein n=1 Tax=Streptomyces qinglanensis TaxID=943816 RepID=UPI0037A6B7FD